MKLKSVFVVLSRSMKWVTNGDWIPHGSLSLTVPYYNMYGQNKANQNIQDTNNISSTFYQSWRNRFGRGQSLFHHILLILLSVLLLSDCIMAAPMYNARGTRRRGRGPKPKWINPCGIDPQMMKNHNMGGFHEVTPLSDSELLQNVILAAKNALLHSEFFKETFVRNTFSSNSFKDHHETWKEQRYNWLPSWGQIPKHLHEALEVNHLHGLKMETALGKIYSYLQRLAVGLEQVVIDQLVYGGDFIQEFNEAEYKLKAVLCEVQVAMLEKGIMPSEDVARNIMSQDVRDIEDQSYRNLRDWYIYRDYMNGLEYVIHSFDHLRKHHYN